MERKWSQKGRVSPGDKAKKVCETWPRGGPVEEGGPGERSGTEGSKSERERISGRLRDIQEKRKQSSEESSKGEGPSKDTFGLRTAKVRAFSLFNTCRNYNF